MGFRFQNCCNCPTSKLLVNTQTPSTPPQSIVEADDPSHAESLRDWLFDFADSACHLNLDDELDRPTFGSTVYIAHSTVEMREGDFTAYIFQDIIHKGYIIALAYGDIINADELYTRMHSSCVTSETLRGCDCDCVQQLEGAIQKIAASGKGVLFYLLQEGRGVGYTAKARDRMLVQASRDTISTFEAYRMLGLRKDYRQYRNISDITKILNITAGWIILTNNPDKVEAMKSQGLVVIRSESLEFEPEPYNLAYLKSKAESGHILERPQDMPLPSVQPPEPVIPFRPRALPDARRFIYMANYFLPIRPVHDQILISVSDQTRIFRDKTLDEYLAEPQSCIVSVQTLRNKRLLVEIDREALNARNKSNPEDPIVELLTMPYWFRAHVYFDIVSGTDFVVLTHGDIKDDDAPVIRIQSESLLNRFPLRNIGNKEKYIRTLQEIIEYGAGAMVLVYHDGRGAGFGAYAVDRMMIEAGRSDSSKESYQKIGVGYDRRDYDGLFTVLLNHVPSKQIQMVMNSPSSLVLKPIYAEALNRHNLEVVNWIFLETLEDE